MEKTEKKGLGRAIRVIRTEIGLSRRDLESRTRLSYPYLSEIEAGKKTPSPVALQAISRALEVPEEALLERARDIEHGRGSWKARHFHTEERASLAQMPAFGTARLYEEPDLMASPSSPSLDPIEELVVLARGLTTEDLARLIDLARRLQR